MGTPITAAAIILQKSRREICRWRRNNTTGSSTNDPKQNRSATLVDTLISRKAILPKRKAVPHSAPADARAAIARSCEVLDSTDGSWVMDDYFRTKLPQ